MVRSLFDMVFPARCMWCGRLPAPLCDECVTELPTTGLSVVRAAGIEFRGLAFGPLDDRLGRLLRAVKDHQQTGLLKAIGPRLSGAFDGLLAAAGHSAAVLVAMPASRSGWRSRGFNTAELIAREVAKHSSFEIELLPALRYRRLVADQRGLDTEHRAANLADAFELTPQARARIARALSPDSTRQPPVFLVDDVITTGATLLSARDAMVAGGIHPAGFFVFAETFLKNASQISKWV
jgi:predicted amidophosphoribosyltransferase